MIKRLLISLDVLLDTRLGVLSTLDKEASEYAVSTKAYWEREHDDWYKLSGGRVTTEAFNKAYAERGGDNTADTLNASVLSNSLPVIHRILGEETLAHMNNKTIQLEQLVVNIDYHPYVLPIELRDELYGIAKELFGESTNIELVNLGYKATTPVHLRENYACFITYDFHAWMQLHFQSLSEQRMTDFTLIGPKLFEKDVSKLDIEVKKRELMRFKLEKLLYMNFEFIDASYFSIITR